MSQTTTEPLTLNAVVSNVLAEIHRRVTRGIEVEFDLCGDAAPVDADADELLRVLLHLFDNACDAMPAGGTVLIQTREIELVSATAAGRPQAFSRLSVADTGYGIPPVNQPRIFDPRFTTKPGRAGLGLTTAGGIVTRFGGFLDFTSAIGAGTVFHVYLPGGRV